MFNLFSWNKQFLKTENYLNMIIVPVSCNKYAKLIGTSSPVPCMTSMGMA